MCMSEKYLYWMNQLSQKPEEFKYFYINKFQKKHKSICNFPMVGLKMWKNTIPEALKVMVKLEVLLKFLFLLSFLNCKKNSKTIAWMMFLMLMTLDFSSNAFHSNIAPALVSGMKNRRKELLVWLVAMEMEVKKNAIINLWKIC